jgi:hypothetical protein
MRRVAAALLLLAALHSSALAGRIDNPINGIPQEIDEGINNPFQGTGPSTPCGSLQFDHNTATGTPPVYACDVIAMPLFGL